MNFKQKDQKQKGFTLIELLVVVAIIALLSSIALIAMISARQKARDTKRLSEMTQMNTALELYNAHYKGYPADDDADGVPDGLQPQFVGMVPSSPTPADGSCPTTLYPGGIPATRYYYVPDGSDSIVNGTKVYSDYFYYFCLGAKTGDLGEGVRIITPRGVR